MSHLLETIEIIKDVLYWDHWCVVLNRKWCSFTFTETSWSLFVAAKRNLTFKFQSFFILNSLYCICRWKSSHLSAFWIFLPVLVFFLFWKVGRVSYAVVFLNPWFFVLCLVLHWECLFKKKHFALLLLFVLKTWNIQSIVIVKLHWKTI